MLGLALTFIGCNAQSENNTIRISDGISTVPVTDYVIKFGKPEDKPIQQGLKLIISELLEISKKQENLKGTITYTYAVK